MILFCFLPTYYPGMHRKSPVHVYPLHVIIYLLDQFTLGVPSDEPKIYNSKSGETGAHRRGRSAGKLLLSREFQDNSALGSKEYDGTREIS